jgi:hypothetical protein
MALCRVHRNPPLNTMVSQINAVYTFSIICLLILSSTSSKRSLTLRYRNKFVCTLEILLMRATCSALLRISPQLITLKCYCVPPVLNFTKIRLRETRVWSQEPYNPIVCSCHTVRARKIFKISLAVQIHNFRVFST